MSKGPGYTSRQTLNLRCLIPIRCTCPPFHPLVPVPFCSRTIRSDPLQQTGAASRYLEPQRGVADPPVPPDTVGRREGADGALT